MPERKKTKIVATLGPATSKREVIKKMMQEGANVFRINFSHADYDDVKERVKMIREIGDEIRTRWPDTGRIVIVHRTGRVDVGASCARCERLLGPATGRATSASTE